MDKQKQGKIVVVESYGHYKDQIIEHARLVARKLGFVDKQYDLNGGNYPNVSTVLDILKKLAEDTGKEPSLKIAADVWLEFKFTHEHVLNILNSWLDQGSIVFIRNYIPIQAVDMAVRYGLEGDAVRDWAQSYCLDCYTKGAPKVDKGVIIWDERLENIWPGGETNYLERDGKEYDNKRSRPLLGMVEGDDRWKVIRSGIDEIPMENGRYVWPEGMNSLWRDYEDVEMETIRHILDLSEEKVNHESLLEVLGSIRFQKADQF